MWSNAKSSFEPRSTHAPPVNAGPNLNRYRRLKAGHFQRAVLPLSTSSPLPRRR